MTDELTNVPIQLTVRGAVPRHAQSYALRKIEHLLGRQHDQVLHATVTLSLAPNPAQEHPARIEVGVVVHGTPVRAHVTATELTEAADLVVDRLQRRLVQLRERTRTRHRWIGVAGEHDWRHGDLPTHPVVAPGGSVVRLKTFAAEPVTADEAAYEMDLLDHDFYLYTDRDTGADAVVYRKSGGGYGVLGHTVALTTQQARERLELSGARFLFYRGASGRGRVMYRRYDGRYGVIVAA
jgi:ribosomal subunit interface protein